MLRLFACVVVLLLLVIQGPIAVSAASYNNWELTGDYITVVDEAGRTILQTGLTIQVGDEYIDEDNRTYRITAVERNIARAHLISQETSILISPAAIPAQAPPAGMPQPSPPETEITNPSADWRPQTIAIYHTHTDESYTPSDGQPTQPGNGGIMLVGDAFARRLQELGYNPVHDKTLHEPHDANAYQRSRRTFTNLLGQQPAALFDIHRDSAPLPIYKTTINGQDTAKLLLVVGRQNQNKNTILDYARQLKSEADKKYQGLVRGIFIAHGNYNQDLHPRALLVEVGTEYNTREAAERGIVLFADIIPKIIAPASNGLIQPKPAAGQPGPYESPPPPTRNYVYDIALILMAAVAGTVAFLYLSTGSWQEVKAKLAKFRKFEFTSFLGPRKKRK